MLCITPYLNILICIPKMLHLTPCFFESHLLKATPNGMRHFKQGTQLLHCLEIIYTMSCADQEGGGGVRGFAKLNFADISGNFKKMLFFISVHYHSYLRLDPPGKHFWIRACMYIMPHVGPFLWK